MEKDQSEKYNVFDTDKGNKVWMGTMVLCWKNFAQTYNLKELTFDTIGRDNAIIETINNFNNCAFSFEDINKNSYYVMAGMGVDTQTLINKEVI
jgi:hypothetical protein